MKLRESNELFKLKKLKHQAVFDEFLASGFDKAEVFYDPKEYTSAHTMHSSLYAGARRWAKGAVDVVMHKRRVFLVRTDR